MITLDPGKIEVMTRSLNLLKIIWFFNFIYCAAVYFLVPMINLPEITSSKYIEYTFGILAIAEIAVALSMRFVRFKPATVKKLMNRDFSEVVRNFFTTEIITLALLDAVVIYGAVLFLLTGKLLFLQLFILLAVIFLIFFFPRLSRWTDAYENASASLNE